MSESESTAETVAERWLAGALESYSAAARTSLAIEDPFRNPAGQVLRENLRLLTREVFGAMNRETIESSLDAIVRLRAVQAFSPSEAIGFVFALRRAADDVPGAAVPKLQERIDTLALMAFDNYMECREQIHALRSRGVPFRAQSTARPE